MTISNKIKQFMSDSSWIRKMFEEGLNLKEKYGHENVYDFSLGNPILDPPEEFFESLKEISESRIKGIHGYMPNSGFKSTRSKISQKISEQSKSNLNSDDILMTSGAAGAINVILHSILNQGEEVIIFKPFFPEYKFYVDNHGGKSLFCDFEEDFTPSMDGLKSLLSPKTKAIILNSPNNPTGITYSEKIIKEICELASESESKFNSNIFIISDEPYRYLEYENQKQPFIFDLHKNGIIASSFSKDLSIAGERVGFIAVGEKLNEKETVIEALNFSNRTLGFVSAPAIGQRLVENSINSIVNISKYKAKRDYFYTELTNYGYKIIKPSGGFYLFPKSPINDIEFTELLKKERILVVPGTGFGAPGYFRISYSVDDSVIKNSLEGFKKAIKKI
ncbi:MAG: pyridoxal phosphate-dependent aminotransferase [Chloroflexota bacterium]|nr:pyridoxal phosphate-dependent aminotransferase [Chloroflexota bacterium]